MLRLSYDLHIHSCLSPCGDADMLPSNIVGMAALKELDVIAVTDHNSCKNCGAVQTLAAQYGVLAIPGMELCTSEEVHVLCLFPTLADAMAFDEVVYAALPRIENNVTIFGNQQICSAEDEILGEEPYLLINAANISFDDVFDLTARYHGIMIPAHIEKSTNSMLSNLGMVPETSRFSCYELKHPGYEEQLRAQHPYLAHCNRITDSDAHYLEHIHEPEQFLEVEERTVPAVLRALGQT